MLIFARLSFCSALVGLGATLFAALASSAEELQSDHAVPWQAFQPITFVSGDIAADGIWRAEIDPPHASYMSLRFAGTRVSNGSQSRLELRDGSGRLLLDYDADFLSHHQTFSAGPLPARKTYVIVRGPAQAGDVGFQVDELRTVQEPTSSHSLSLRLDLEPLTRLAAADRARGWARGVAQLKIADHFLCTGFLVRPTLLITNYHCLEKSVEFNLNKDNCSDIVPSFDFDRSPFTPTPPLRRCIKVENKAVAPDDLAALRLDGPAPGAPRALQLASSDTTTDPVTIIEHPFGLPTMVTRCSLGTGFSGVKIYHDCNSAGGASGSPILNKDGDVIAIHSNGYAKDDATEAELFAAYFNCLSDPANPTAGANTCGLNKATSASALTKLLRDVP